MDDSRFLQAVLAAPGNDDLRQAYADWLEEQGDPRADYLRISLALAGDSVQGDTVVELRRILNDLRGRIDPLWLAHMEQPGVMRANPTPFQASWVTFGIEEQEVSPTYGNPDYHGLPPLPVERFDGSFQWLREHPLPERPVDDDESTSSQESFDLGVIRDQAAALGLALPESFLRFFRDPDLPGRVRSCTDCYFDMPARIVPSPAGEDTHLLRFYSDSQGCVHWYLSIRPGGSHCVIASPDFFGGMQDYPDEEDDEQDSDTWFCAPSFEAFLYRCWIENEIWHARHWDHDPLTPAEQAYVDHYRDRNAS